MSSWVGAMNYAFMFHLKKKKIGCLHISHFLKVIGGTSCHAPNIKGTKALQKQSKSTYQFFLFDSME